MTTTSERQARKLTRQERMQRCFDAMDQGLSNAEVCRRIGISLNTATKYRRLWEERNAESVQANSALFTDVLSNTVRMLAENEQVRKSAWQEYHAGVTGVEVHCPECEFSWIEPFASAQTRNAMLQTVMKAQEHRAKLLGVMGIKAEFYSMVVVVKALQDKLLEYMARELCDDDRHKLDEYLRSPELAMYFASSGYAGRELPMLDVVEAEAVEAV